MTHFFHRREDLRNPYPIESFLGTFHVDFKTSHFFWSLHPLNEKTSEPALKPSPSWSISCEPQWNFMFFFRFFWKMRTSHSQPNVIPNCTTKRRVSKPLWTTYRRISAKVRVGSRWTTRVPLPSLDLLQLEGPGKQLPVLVCYGSDHSTPNFPGILQQFSWT